MTVKEDRVCKFRKGAVDDHLLKLITLGSNATDLVTLCETKCIEKQRCLGFELYGRKCKLVDKDVVGFQRAGNKNNNNNNKTYSCGMRMKTTSPTQAPTTSSLPTESHNKVFEFDEDTRCKLLKGETRKSKVYLETSREQCDNKCGHKKKCKSYSWKHDKCTLFHFRVKGTRKNKEGSVCARVPKVTKAPAPPSPSPTSSPTKKPECKLQVKLGFNFKNPNNAPFFGTHADWMEVSKKDYKSGNDCSSYYDFHDKLPGWCKYKNSKPKGDSAMVENYEDKYYTLDYLEKYETVTSETIIIKDAADEPTQIKVYHWLFDEDYYPGLDEWDDHLMIPTLTIVNLSNDSQEKIGRDLKHPAKTNESDQMKKNGNWVGNPKYVGNISVEIHCNKFCRCEQKKYHEFGGFEDM